MERATQIQNATWNWWEFCGGHVHGTCRQWIERSRFLTLFRGRHGEREKECEREKQ